MSDARATLKVLLEDGRYKEAYVKDAGPIRVSALFGGDSTPAITSVLLGELRVSTEEKARGEGCEPDEPFIRVTLSFVSLVGGGGGGTVKPLVQTVDIGALDLIKRTGELVRRRICVE